MNISPPTLATAMRWLTHQATSSLASIIPLRPSLIHVVHPAAIAAIILPHIYIAPRHLRAHLQLAIPTPMKTRNFTFITPEQAPMPFIFSTPLQYLNDVASLLFSKQIFVSLIMSLFSHHQYSAFCLSISLAVTIAAHSDPTAQHLMLTSRYGSGMVRVTRCRAV
ncbi:hypothetical protein BJ165DRAFT_870349 [Panaeolus papilionaceus]|nr:hypothetical protein BJ165DRAFT_870349 [Panaeolus papilionaceus]